MKEERLKHVAHIYVSNVDKKSADGDAQVRLCNYTDVYYNERITGSLDFMSATATRDQLAKFGLRKGDVILTKDSETADDIGISALVTEDVNDLVCGYHLAVVRANRERADGRYLRWVLASTSARQRMSAAATGVTRFGLRSEVIADLPVPLPLIAHQRVIADYLDRETARLDALIEAKRRMAKLLEERLERQTSALLFDPNAYHPVRLKFICGLPTSGNRDHNSFTYTSDGVPCLRGIDLSKDTIDLSTVLRISAEDSQRHAHTRLHVGDLVIVRSGATAGRSAFVTRDLDGSNCVDLVVVRRSRALESRYLAYVVRSREIQDRVIHESSGALQPHFNAVDAGEIQVPMRSMDDQRRVVKSLDDLTSSMKRMVDALDRQTNLLQERRQALITTAVAGQLDNPEAV